MLPRRLTLLAVLLLTAGFVLITRAQTPPADAYAMNKALGRGINLGNALDAPNEGDWGVVLQDHYFKDIHDAGFDSVRIPVRFSEHALADAPYTIDPTFFNRVQWAVDQAVANHLAVVLNFHHYYAMFNTPETELPRFLALWKQVAERFKDYPDTLVFELLNQPTDNLNAELWNKIFPQLLAVVRRSNPTRFVMIGPAEANRLTALADLQLPTDDRRIIVSFHYYSPYHFTAQATPWTEGSSDWAGTTWTATDDQTAAVIADFNIVTAWAVDHDRPINLGEFGSYEGAPTDSRIIWTRYMAQQARMRGFSFHYWEFCSGYGAYDPQTNQWRKPLLNALLGSE
jgi:endoglucanase